MDCVDFKSWEAKLDSILKNGDSNTSLKSFMVKSYFQNVIFFGVATKLNIKIVTCMTKNLRTLKIGPWLGSGASAIEPFAVPELRIPDLKGDITWEYELAAGLHAESEDIGRASCWFHQIFYGAVPGSSLAFRGIFASLVETVNRSKTFLSN